MVQLISANIITHSCFYLIPVSKSTWKMKITQSEKVVYGSLETVLTRNEKLSVCPFEMIETNRNPYNWEIKNKTTPYPCIYTCLLGIYIAILISRLSEAYAMEDEAVGFLMGSAMIAYTIYLSLGFVLLLEAVSKRKEIVSVMQEETIFYSKLAGSVLNKFLLFLK